MYNFISKRSVRVISLIIAQSFLITSLSWAAPGGAFSFKENSTLSPTIQISQPAIVAGFQNRIDSNKLIVGKMLANDFFVIDPILVNGVKDVEIVQTLSEPLSAQGKIEGNLDLMHAQGMAALEVLKWINNVGSKFAKSKADGAGARWTRNYYNDGIPWMKGTVVIGEGERDKAAMLYIGEEVGGAWNGTQADSGVVEVDIAGDVVELTNGIVKTDVLGTASVASYSEKGGTLNAPDIYMTKWAVGPAAKGCGISAELPVEENLDRIAGKLGKDLSGLRGAMLLRERHVGWLVKFFDAGIRMNVDSEKELAALISAYRDFQKKKQIYLGGGKDAAEALNSLKAAKENLVKAYKALDKKVKAAGKYKIGNFYLLADGDLMPVWSMADSENGEIDFLTGAGGAPEAVLSASAMETMGGEMSARFCAYEVLKEAAKSEKPEDWPEVDEDWHKFTAKELTRLSGFGYDSPETTGKVRSSQELISGNDVVFIASAIKDSPWLKNLKGVSFDAETGLITVYTLRATKSGDIRIWRIRYETPAPELKAKLAEETDALKKSELHYQLSSVYGRASRLDLAIGEINQAVSTTGLSQDNLNKYHAAMYFYEGKKALLQEKGQEIRALELFREAYKIYHKDEVRARDLILELAEFIGDNFAKVKDYDQAVAYYKIAVRITPEDQQLLAKVSKTEDLVRQSQPKKAKSKSYSPFPAGGFKDAPGAGFQEALTYLLMQRDKAFTKAVGGTNTADLVARPEAGKFAAMGGHILYEALRKSGQAVTARNVLTYAQLEGHIREAMASNSVLLIESARSQFAGTAIDENTLMKYIKEIVERLGCDIPIVVHGDHVQYTENIYKQKKVLELEYDKKHGDGSFKKKYIEEVKDDTGKVLDTIVHYELVDDLEVLQAAQDNLRAGAEKERKAIAALNERLIKAGFSSIAIDASTIFDAIAGEIVEKHYLDNGTAAEKLVIGLEQSGRLPLEFGVEFLKLDSDSEAAQARYKGLAEEIRSNMQKRGKSVKEINQKMEELRLAFGALVREARNAGLDVEEVLSAYDQIMYEIAQATIAGKISNKIKVSDNVKKLLLPTSNLEETKYQLGKIDELLSRYAPELIGKFGKEVEVGHVDAKVINPVTKESEAKLTHPMAVRVMVDGLKAAGLVTDLVAVNNGSGHGTQFDKKNLVPISQVGKISPYISREQQGEAAKSGASLAQHGTSGSDDLELYDLSNAGIIKFNIATIYQQIVVNTLSLLDDGLRGDKLIEKVMVDQEALSSGLHESAREKMKKLAAEIEKDPSKAEITGEESLFEEVMKRIYAWAVSKKKLSAKSAKEQIGTALAKEAKRTFKIMDGKLYDAANPQATGETIERQSNDFNILTGYAFVNPETAGFQEALTYLLMQRDKAFTKAVGGTNTADLVARPEAG
ncbi:MAG: fructose-bisphosphatase class II, partial [Candidatus Omnitrophica bacterium]|nr:fructose-bisphosphatase class II [Candidatus Omnitrophota bacterium]